MTPPGAARHCASCGQPIAEGASFCRNCGNRYEGPAPAQSAAAPRQPAVPPAEKPSRSRTAIWAGLAIVLIGAGAAVAILLSSGGGASSTTVLVRSNGETETASGGDEGQAAETAPQSVASSVEAGRYVQAGSFKTVPHAEAERERLASAGIDVQVVSSDGVEEFYPGFQVLLSGPFEAGSEESSTLKALRQNGVPSAFVRAVTPAQEIGGAGETSGGWSGVLERSSGERPGLNGSLAVSLEMDSSGESGALEFEDTGCREELALGETTATTISYSQGSSCVGRGDILVRPGGGQLMLTLQPLDTDVLILGTLSPG